MLLADVARAAGVSVATASRALAGRGDLRPQTRDRVRAAATELGYVAGGRGAAAPTSRHVDLVLRRFDGRWAGTLAREVRTAAAERGLDLMLTEERDSPDDDWPVRIRARGSRGVLLGVVHPTADQLATMRAARIPVVSLEPRSGTPSRVPTVSATDREGAAEAADHLIARGAERFAVVVPTPAYRYGRARVRGFVDRVRSAAPGSVPTTVAVGSSGTTARRRIAALLSTPGPGRWGVFAGTDELAVQVYRAAAAAGLGIPDDVLVVGFDDVPGATYMDPPLTSVHQPLDRMARAALDLVLTRRGQGVRGDAVSVVLPTTLAVRGSTG